MRIGPLILRSSDEKKRLKAFKKKIQSLEEEYGFVLTSTDGCSGVAICRILDDGTIEDINSKEAYL